MITTYPLRWYLPSPLSAPPEAPPAPSPAAGLHGGQREGAPGMRCEHRMILAGFRV